MADTPEQTTIPDTSELDVVRAKLAATEQELANYKLRLADFENARKRLLRDAEVERKYAAEPFARDLLAALDNLDRALDAAKSAGDTGPLAMGVAATVSQILDVLRRHGVKMIDCAPGTDFDPNLHQAVGQEVSATHREGEVIDDMRRGYRLGDRLLRPSMVKVATRG